LSHIAKEISGIHVTVKQYVELVIWSNYQIEKQH